MKGKNAYFQLYTKDDGTYLKLFEAQPGGRPLVYDEISKYLIDKKIYEYDKLAIGKAIANLKEVAELKISSVVISPQNEYVRVQVDGIGCMQYADSTLQAMVDNCLQKMIL